LPKTLLDGTTLLHDQGDIDYCILKMLAYTGISQAFRSPRLLFRISI